MSDVDTPLAQVDELLQQRQKYEQWLAKLDQAGTRAPESVRNKVRADYQARLEAVVAELGTHVESIEAALAGRRETVAGLDARRSDVEERLAEAEVRHAVGEYTDDEWSAVASEAQAVLDDLAGRLAGEQAEIARLNEVQRLVTKPAGAPPPAVPAAVAPPAPEPVAASPELTLITEPDLSSEKAETPEPSTTPTPLRLVEDEAPSLAADAGVQPIGAPRFVPKTPMPSRPVSPRPAAPADELAFLKSVTGDAPQRKVIPVRKPGEGAPAAVETPAASSADTGEATSRSTQQKTLKCGECGTLNRPTEWYCERCGAELAAL
ncbi:MAG TPA: hypothetical protein VFY20_01415 [Gemmatimonadales bacterium]|nr:hypothetical protein [Gemmatimonadales bacterium]